MSSSPTPPAVDEHPLDSTEAVLPYIPVVLPLVGAVLMFLLAFIAVTLA
ncbi:hypothetical protein N0K08_12345 [Acidovorax sp. Be4]|jgi:hypothetical protein|uniref:Uncharacterized protein n=1 Tax=Acidovorax bellezanensis TaxID=2976702 RepID=A0ABT2PMF2_9BURK|nr:hypothetical protein [Acidovorax sp. Be4]MCT9811430.1 hypothetical protein [Acidovorax sp. Be4]